MPITEQQTSRSSGETDRIVASLKTQGELIRRLITEIETDSVSPQAFRIRVFEIQAHARLLRDFL